MYYWLSEAEYTVVEAHIHDQWSRLPNNDDAFMNSTLSGPKYGYREAEAVPTTRS